MPRSELGLKGKEFQLSGGARTGYETNNAETVLNGDIDDFIQAFLRSEIGREEDQDISEKDS